MLLAQGSSNGLKDAYQQALSNTAQNNSLGAVGGLQQGQLGQQLNQNYYQQPYYQPYYPGGVCPTCNYCPTCGRRHGSCYPNYIYMNAQAQQTTSMQSAQAGNSPNTARC